MNVNSHNYIWTIKNITKSPVYINDLPPNGLMIITNENVNLHDRYSLSIVENSKSLRNAFDLGLIKTLKKETFEEPNRNYSINSINSKDRNLKDEIEELKDLVKNSLTHKSDGISKEDLLEILNLSKGTPQTGINIEEISNIVKKTVIETMGSNISIKSSEEVNKKNYNNLDVSTNFILNSKRIGNNVEVSAFKKIDEKIVEDDGSNDLDQLADLID